MVSPSTLADDAAHAISRKVSRQKILHHVAAMQDRVLLTLPKHQAKYKRYIDKNICTLPTFTIRQQVYSDWYPLGLFEKQKSSTQYNKLKAHMTGLLTIMDVKSHFITIGKHGIPNTIFICRTTLVPANAYVMTRITHNLVTSSHTMVSHSTDSECKDAPE